MDSKESLDDKKRIDIENWELEMYKKRMDNLEGK